MLPHDAARATAHYLAVADRLLPKKITGFYVVGSAALGAWQPRCSDVDFIAVVAGGLDDGQVRRLRALHLLGNAPAAGRSIARIDPTLPGTVNGAFVSAADLAEPVTRIDPLASHSGWSFHRGRAFEVNPVVWKVLRDGGIALRGPAPAGLGLDPEPDRLRAWNLDQLRGHWRSWANRLLSGQPRRKPLVPAHRLAVSRVLGPPRLHHTVVTGEVISKEAAAEYALDTFGHRWQPLVRAALAQRGGPPVPDPPAPGDLLRLAGEFTLEVVADAERRP
ncbi:aminoglycoside adenylyltransferase domain-containing protein [Actinosynnema sp. NPDC023587]|uniref:aminoglycoside adenylyltransferase domain-containing protein n=1 Tax=Actinosynnema sp. NPDC023587 TaxID=3154695 RepID=UPI0033C7E7D5